MTIGRLIFPSRIVMRLLETDAMRSASKYDDQFREPIKTDTDGDGIGTTERSESSDIIILGQVATRTFERFEQLEHGEVPETPNLEVTFHFRDLDKAGLVESDGRAKIKTGVRLVRIEDRAGNTVIAFDDPSGMYVASARPSGFLGRTRNLWVVTFSDRRQAGRDPRPRQL